MKRFRAWLLTWFRLAVSADARERRRFSIAWCVCATVLQLGPVYERDARRRLLLRALHSSWIDFQKLVKQRNRMESAAAKELRQTDLDVAGAGDDLGPGPVSHRAELDRADKEYKRLMSFN